MGGCTLRIGELSRQTGCQIETIRYYERIGVLPQANRRGRYRCYESDDVARLRFIHRARKFGFSLREIRTLSKLAKDRGARSCERVKMLAGNHLQTVRQRIADLEGLAAVLAKAVARCEDGTLGSCPVIDTLEGAAG